MFDTPISYWTLAISIVGLILLAIPAIRGMRFGANFATTLAILSMIPLTFLAIAWIFNPSVVHFNQLFNLERPNGSGFLDPLFGHGWLTLYIAFSFLLTWNVIAMEAAACYIGETKNPDRDAKIAMNLEGLYGLFIYTMIPVAFIIVIGVHALGNPALVDPQTMFVTFASKVFGAGAGSNLLDWLVAIMLILALILSALNAITGTARSLHQMSTDGQFPKFFQKVNHHGVPDRAMIFNVVCSILVVFAGGAVQIYTMSNVGYLASFIPVLVGYYLLRKHRPNVRRPFKLPEWMKYVAIAHRAAVRRHLLLRRPDLRQLRLQRGGHHDASVLLHRMGRAPALPAAVLVPQTRRGQARVAGRSGAAAPGGRRGGRGLSAAAPVAEPTPGQARFRRILLASEGRPIPPAAVARVVELAEPGANVHVFTIARIHGTAFGMPSPGLFPTKKEWAAQRDIVRQDDQAAGAQGLGGQRPRARDPQRHQEDHRGGQEGGLRGHRHGRRR